MGQNPGHIWVCAAIAIAARGDRAIFARLPSAANSVEKDVIKLIEDEKKRTVTG
jgi:hypothetical protein